MSQPTLLVQFQIKIGPLMGLGAEIRMTQMKKTAQNLTLSSKFPFPTKTHLSHWRGTAEGRCSVFTAAWDYRTVRSAVAVVVVVEGGGGVAVVVVVMSFWVEEWFLRL